MATAEDNANQATAGQIVPVVSQFSDEATQKKLIAACNLLCEHASEKLPPSWEIRLSLFKDEASMSLIDPSGEEIECDSPDWNIATIDDLCVSANERHDKLLEGASDAVHG